MKHLRAVLVLLHVLAITLLAFPAPVGGMTKRAFAHRDTQATFRSYTDALNAIGVGISQEQLEEVLWEAGTGFMKARREVLAPIRPYAKATGSQQGWRMFGMVNRRPAWLVVDVQEAGTWRTVYEMRSEEHTWRRAQLDQERVRAVVNNYSWLRDQRSYQDFGLWLAKQAATDFPEATHLRTTMVRRPLPDPQVLADEGMPAGKAHWAREYSLDKHR